MITQLHIRVKKTLLRWVMKKACSENRSTNNYIATLIIQAKSKDELIKKETVDANLGTKDSQAQSTPK